MYVSYMKVEAVLRWLNLKNNAFLTQYQLIENGKPLESNFFKCSDIEKRIGKEKFRLMECDVVQHLIPVTIKEANDNDVVLFV